MRLNFIFSDTNSENYSPEFNTTPNPNKYNFSIKELYRISTYTILIVNYPNCTTFNGDKLLVFKGRKSIKEFNELKELDPHFLESNIDLIGRFRTDQLEFVLKLLKLTETGI